MINKTRGRVRVGGSYLAISRKGLANLKIHREETKLLNILYIPELGVNLLSIRKLYKKGLEGRLDIT